MSPTLSPQDAWRPLPATEWNADAARHLLRRTGWTARPEDVERATREGLAATLDRCFPADPPRLPVPKLVARLEEAAPGLQRSAAQLTGEERLRAQREIQERSRIALQDLSLKWMQFAAQPRNAAVAKWVLFLSDVYVVSAEKVRNPALIHEHYDILTRYGFGAAPELTKAVSRSPAMVIYLDLNQSQKQAPNENFARELFELFVLGEGNYTENDIKQAARAFTGYRTQPIAGGFRYVAAQHDNTNKTVFGATGNFTGDDVIELAYSTPAASRFLPHEMVKFYLSDTPLPIEYLTALGDAWRISGFELRALQQQFFGSQLFFAPEFRGNFIKSPLQFYFGLVQDLRLDVAPLPRFALNPPRAMGQWLFYPPNVRGWVGGRSWINSATLAARRQLVESLFIPIDEKSLNADEQVELVAAHANGVDHFTVTDDLFAPLATKPPAEAAETLTRDYLGGDDDPDVRNTIRDFLASGAANPKQRLQRLRRAAVTVMQSADYQLC